MTFSFSGSFRKHIDVLKNKARKAFFSLLIKSKQWRGMDPKMSLYLFDHLIKPIVEYGSEVWGFRDWDELETLHLQACKYALGVRSTTTSAAVYSELGRRPLITGRLIAFKYANRLKTLSCDRYAKKHTI